MDFATQMRALPSTDQPTWPDTVRRLLIYGRYLGATLEEAEDLVNDVLEHIVRNPDWFDPERGEWIGSLKVILRNRYFNRLRSADVHRRATPHLRVVEPEPLPDETLQVAQARGHRQRVLALLSEDERRVFAAWMRQRGGLQGEQAAAELGLSHPAYEAAKKRVRRRVQAVLAELELTPADLFDHAPGATS